MRLLYLTADPGVPVFGGKGASVHVRATVRAFARLGHEVIVSSPRLESGEEELPVEVRCVEIPAVRPRSFPTEAEVLAAMDEQTAVVAKLATDARVDAIYERYSLTSCAGARVAARLGIPLVVEVNAPLREEELRFRQLAHEPAALAAEQETFAGACLIVAVSAWLRDWLSSIGVSPERVAVIPNPPPEQLFGPRAALAERETVTVGFAGSLKPWHGVETLVDGFLAAARRGARMRLEIMGDGPAAGAVDTAIGDSQQISRLSHLPHREALARLAMWDIGAAPYRSIDGFYFSPLKLAEYMAAGLCPVVSRLGPLPGLVEHGQAGVIVPPDDPDALADALLALDSDRPRLNQLGRRAQSVARDQPTWTEIAERLSDVMSGTGTVDASALAVKR